MSSKTVYCVTMITQLDDNISIDCVAVYSDKDTAIEIAKEMEDNHQKLGFSGESIYDVFDFTLDEEPILLDFQRKRLKQIAETNDKVDEALTELMNSGLVEQLIGEDGHFYYELTSEGRGVSDKIPALVKKLFKKD